MKTYTKLSISALALTTACAEAPQSQEPNALDVALSVGNADQSISATEATIDGFPAVQLNVVREVSDQTALEHNAVTYECADTAGQEAALQELAGKFILYAIDTTDEQRQAELSLIKAHTEGWHAELCNDL